MIRKNLVGAALAVLASAGMLAGCGDTESSSPPANTTESEHNDADVSFLQQMIPHHQQAIDMAKLVDGRTTTAAVVDLAGKVQKAQDPEIEQMTAWLKEWGEDTAADHSMPGMDHGMPGMMSDEQMAQLEQATGAAFDQLWVTLMIAHHQGAIDMANAELADGANDDVKALAKRISTAQEAEIRQMQDLTTQS
jgi:uncharacterized protein (DUF305 family)